MNVEQALSIVDTVLQPERLSDVQELLFRECWLGKSYYEIAEEFDYEAGYLRVVGSRLWKDLSYAFGERITKNNICSVFRQKMRIHEQVGRGTTELKKSSTNQLPTTIHPLATAVFPGCLLSLNSPFYVERPPIESRCCCEILQPGALIRIKAPKEMGKTLLLKYILNYANNQGCRTVHLNFQQADQEAFGNLNNFLRWLCKIISWNLKLEPKLDEYWDQDSGLAKYSCTRYFEEYLLKQLDSPLVLGLDELERVFFYPKIAQDFLPLLRVWHEQANEGEIWEQLRLVVVHSTEVYPPLNINQSPFNIGLPIVLPEWNYEQVQALARAYGLNWDKFEAEQLMAMVGGHPYLVQLTLYHLQGQDVSLVQLLQDAPTVSGIYINHLRHLENLQAAPELSAAMKEVVSNKESVLLSNLAYQLRSIGLVKFDGNKVMPSCQLYRQYFHTMLSTHEQ